MTLKLFASFLMVVIFYVHDASPSEAVNIGNTLQLRPIKDFDSYTIVLPGKTLNISCPGSITTIDVYSTISHTSLRIYVLRELLNSRETGTTRYEVIAQTEFQTNSVGIERHGLVDFIKVRAGDVIALGYFEDNPVPYTGVSGTCSKENRCGWYRANTTAQMIRESKNNTVLSLTEADNATVFPCRVYSIQVTLQAVDGCVKTASGGGQRVVEFLGIAVAVAFAIVLMAVNIHNLTGPSSRSHTDTPGSPSTDIDSEGGSASMSGAMYAPREDGLDSWPMQQWKGGIMTPPPYSEFDPAPPAPSPPPYQVFTLPQVDV